MSTLPFPSPSEKAPPSRRSERGLDGFAFFLADLQTGWGPFVAVYLTAKHWTPFDIGLILTIGTLSGMVLQLPLGALVDRVPGKRRLAALAVIAISASALLLAFWPVFRLVVVAKLLHALASGLAGPVLAALSLGLVGHTRLSQRLGRNARFLSLGNAIAAALMGVIAHYASTQAIFLVTAALGVPTLVALAQIRAAEIDPALARGGRHDREAVAWPEVFRWLVRMPALLIFAAAVVLFQLANAAMLPILAGALTVQALEGATLIVALCILAPQFVVAALAPGVGRAAQRRGRRPLLMLCFLPLCVRGAVFAVSSDPLVLVAAQLLDGISAATLGVLVPLVIADTTRGSGHFNFAQGVVGVAVGIGASLSTTLAGTLADRVGTTPVFLALAGMGALGLLLVVVLMPETRDAPALSGAIPA